MVPTSENTAPRHPCTEPAFALRSRATGLYAGYSLGQRLAVPVLAPLAKARTLRCRMAARAGRADDPAVLEWQVVEMRGGHPAAHDNDHARDCALGFAVNMGVLPDMLGVIEQHFNRHPDRRDRYFVSFRDRPDFAQQQAIMLDLGAVGRKRSFFVPTKQDMAKLRMLHGEHPVQVAYDFEEGRAL